MDIYLTDLETNDRLRFPILPESIEGRMANQFYNYQIINIGEVRIPSGTALDAFSWDCFFPGASRKKAPYIRKWRDPQKCVKWLNGCKTKKGKAKKLRLLITETPFNVDVYLDSFTPKPQGGNGDIFYTLALIQAKDIIVSTSAAVVATAAAPAPIPNKATNEQRPAPPPAKTYTVVKGDTLWGIAQKQLGKGARYTEIHNANKGVIGGDPNKIYPGQVLTIPS